jgi:hypothetical protein
MMSGKTLKLALNESGGEVRTILHEAIMKIK